MLLRSKINNLLLLSCFLSPLTMAEKTAQPLTESKTKIFLLMGMSDQDITYAVRNSRGNARKSRAVSRKWVRTTLLNEIRSNLIKNLNSNSFEVIAQASATQYDLWTALHDTSVGGIVWVSHGGLSSTIFEQDRVVDTHGKNVKSLFSYAHPNMHFIAVVACNSEDILSDLEIEENTLNLYTVQGKITPVQGIRDISNEINNNSFTVKDTQFSENPIKRENLIELRIIRERTESANNTQLKIKNEHGWFDYLDRVPDHQRTKEFVVSIPENSKKITFERVKPTNNSFGEIIHLPPEWRVFQTQAGEPIGSNTRIFRK